MLIKLLKSRYPIIMGDEQLKVLYDYLGTNSTGQGD